MDDSGVAYRDFRRSLAPRYGRIWLQIAAGYAALAGIPAALVLLDAPFPWSIAAGVVGALAIGYVLAYLNNFFHEAAHYNLLPDRKRNDRVTNVLMAWLYGSTIADYRRVHYQHHRALGTTRDSENSYFDALRIRTILAALFGVRAVKAVRRRRRVAEIERRRGTRAAERRAPELWIALGVVIHLAIAAGLWALGSAAAALAWIFGVAFAAPFFIGLRQVLEHRSEDARADIDYTDVDQGAVTRLFGDGPVASTLGSAGFNRHALHHWDPNVSYTRLRDVETYLLRTPAAPAIRERQTTYSETFLRLLEL